MSKQHRRPPNRRNHPEWVYQFVAEHYAQLGAVGVRKALLERGIDYRAKSITNYANRQGLRKRAGKKGIGAKYAPEVMERIHATVRELYPDGGTKAVIDALPDVEGLYPNYIIVKARNLGVKLTKEGRTRAFARGRALTPRRERARPDPWRDWDP